MKSAGTVRPPAARKSRDARPGAAETLVPRAGRLVTTLWRVQADPSDEDALHDARVAARRLLVAGDLWAPGAPGWAGLRERLPKLVRRLGRVRNFDVTLRFLEEFEGHGRARAELAEALKRQRRKERRRLSEWLTPRRVRGLAVKVRLTGQAASRDGEAPARPSALGEYFDRLVRRVSRLKRQGKIEAGHEARRELRRLRYAHETMAWAYHPGQFAGASKRFADAQDLAGRWHDLCVLDELADWAVRKKKVSDRVEAFRERVRAEARAMVPRVIDRILSLAELRPRLTGGEAR